MLRPSHPLPKLQSDVIDAAREYCQALRGDGYAAALIARLEHALATLDAAQPLERGPLAGLTPTQLDILGRMAQGDGNAEIAGDLGIKTGTLKVHTTAIFKALGVVNRIQAVDTWWRQHGEPGGLMTAMAKVPKLKEMVAMG